MEQPDSFPLTRLHASASAPALPSTPTMPPIRRGTMVPAPWRGLRGLARRLANRNDAASTDRPVAGTCTGARADAGGSVASGAPDDVARARRRTLLLLIAASAALAGGMMEGLQAEASPHPWLQWTQVALFSLLFAWVAAGCFTAVMGYRVLLRGDAHALSRRSAWRGPLDAGARTAVVMPICNEDATTVFSGLRATWESLMAGGDREGFDLYILSDSSDADALMAEHAAWLALREAAGSSGARIHYRRRKVRARRKAGNVADFCRRWGRNYRYMVVLDADSVMSGDCVATLVRLMEAHPSAGILQTAPQACGLGTVHARAQQFASRVAGRLFTAGMQYWQLGEAHYWGHNAIIRVEPFMRHCALASIRGRGILRGEILSHDFVEAALMRRAGYRVWLVHDLAGSYEQSPPHLLAELQRDRRWCQGNLQNARLVVEPGLHPVHRAMLVTGAMAYLSAPLWLVYMSVGAAAWLTGAGPAASVSAGALADASMSVAGSTAGSTAGAGLAIPALWLLWLGTFAMLALPRVLGVAAIIQRDEQRFFGGTRRLVTSAILEGFLSIVQAPLRMVAHTLFVIGAITGCRLEWKSPPREASDVGWADAARHFAPAGLGVLALAGLAAAWLPSALPWLLPVGLPLLLAVPLTVFTSRAAVGSRLRAAGLLLVPEEAWMPRVLRRAEGWARHARRAQPVPGGPSYAPDAAGADYAAALSSTVGVRIR